MTTLHKSDFVKQNTVNHILTSTNSSEKKIEKSNTLKSHEKKIK